MMTYNLRVDLERDGGDAWGHRREQVASLIRFHRPDVLGTQEGTRAMLGYLDAQLDGYAWVGTARDGDGGEHCAIYYRPRRIVLYDYGTFWLSDTPEETASRGWDAAYPRVVTWAHLAAADAPDDVWTVFNTHFDHEGSHARIESARLLAHRTAPHTSGASDRVIVMGDLNATPETDVYRTLADTDHLHDARERTVVPPHGPPQTFNGFASDVEAGRRIDYVFVSDDVRVRRYGTLAERWGGRFPSDHCPVMVDVESD